MLQLSSRICCSSAARLPIAFALVSWRGTVDSESLIVCQKKVVRWASLLWHSDTPSPTLYNLCAVPLLWFFTGLKFDLRCYMVCVQNSASSRPTFYLYGDGLARFATQPYRDGAGTVPGGGALCHSQHLTNYTVNNTQPNTGWQGLRHSWFGVGAGDKDATTTATSTATAAGTPAGQAGRFLESGDAAGVGGVDASGNILSHKWSAAEALLFLESDTGSAAAGEAARVHGLAKAAGAHPPLQPAPAPEPSWASIESLVAGVLVAVLDAPLARHGFAHAHAHAHATLGPPTSKAVSAPTAPAVAEMAEEEGVRRFELVGVDVMFDDSNTSHIIELQRRPDLSPTSPLDLRVKSELLQGLDAILDMHGQQCRGLNGPGDRDVSGLPGGWRRVALPECDFTLPDGSPLWKEWLRVDTALCDAMAAEKGAWAVAEKAIRDSAAFSNMR